MNVLDSLFGSKFYYQAACYSNKGKVRKNNEDNFYFDGFYMPEDNDGLSNIEEKESELKNNTFFAVFDGMGGGDYGEIASHTSASFAKEFLSDSENICKSDISSSLKDMCFEMNQKVFEVGEDLGAYMFGSTIASVYFHENLMWFTNIGDSRAYLYRDSELIQVSKDHIESVTPNSRQKPALLQHLGIDPEEIMLDPTIKRLDVKKDDVILLCSDGLTDMVDPITIAGELSQNQSIFDAVKNLFHAAMNGGGIDNITIIIIRITGR